MADVVKRFGPYLQLYETPCMLEVQVCDRDAFRTLSTSDVDALEPFAKAILSWCEERRKAGWR